MMWYKFSIAITLAFVGSVYTGPDIESLIRPLVPLFNKAQCALAYIQVNFASTGFKIGDIDKLFKKTEPALTYGCGIKPNDQALTESFLTQILVEEKPPSKRYPTNYDFNLMNKLIHFF